MKKKGRPRKFDIDQALANAIQVFWKKGYDGASLVDLTTAMQINGPSLYSAFGNKHDLFLKAIEAYINDNNCGPIIAFEQETDINKALNRFFKEVINDSFKSSDDPTGCFLGSCVAASAENSEDIQTLLKKAILETEKRLAGRFDLEKKKGNLPSGFPSEQRAKLIFDLRQGFAFRARAGLSKSELSKDLDQLVQTILSNNKN